MTKKVKIMTSLFGIVGVSALAIGAVVSCSSKNESNNDESKSTGSTTSSSTSSNSSDSNKITSPSTYNPDDGWNTLSTTVVSNPAGGSWTSTQAATYFQSKFDELSSDLQSQSVIDSIKAGIIAYNNYLNDKNITNPKWPKISNDTIYSDTSSYVITQKFALSYGNVTGSNNSYSFEMVWTDTISAKSAGKTFPDIAVSTITQKFDNVPFEYGLTTNSFSTSNSQDTYAAFLLKSSSYTYTETWNTVENGSSADGAAIVSALIKDGFGNNYNSTPTKGGGDPIEGFIYVYDGGINFGKINS